MSDTFVKFWFAFVGLVAVIWVGFLIWGGIQLIDILRSVVQ